MMTVLFSTLNDSGFGDDSLNNSVEGHKYSLRRRNKGPEQLSISSPLHTSTPQTQRRGRKRVQPVVPTHVTHRTRGRTRKAASEEDLSLSVDSSEEKMVGQQKKKHKPSADSSKKMVERQNKKKHKPDENSSDNEQIEPVKQVEVVSLDHSHSGLKLWPCRACANCIRPDCRRCVFCKDKKKYGGPNIKKQKCQLKEKCSRPSVLCPVCKGDDPDPPKLKTGRNVKHDKTPAVEILPDTPAECGFCHQGHQEDPLQAGKMFSINGVVSHYFCMLFSYDGSQLGTDREGLFGYYGEEVKHQMETGQDTSCQYCYRPGATVRCSQDQCEVSIHFPCGQEAGATFQFMGRMLVFCRDHRLKQSVETFPTPPDTDCVICYDEVDQLEVEDIKRIVAPCCGRHLHRYCVQRFAMSCGTKHFKCPNCNNRDEIVKEFKQHGVYIPYKDAEWELPEQSSFYNFQDMYLRQRRCNVLDCACKEEEGRRYNEVEGEYAIVLCELCGTNGAHVKCANISDDTLEYVCDDCGGE